jgi:HK97 family phage portal protein
MNSLTTALKALVPSPSQTGKRSAGAFDFLDYLGSSPSKTSISTGNALTLPAYYNAINQISNDIAKLPKGIFQKVEDGRESVDHPIKYLINKEPNNLMTAFDFHFVMMLAAIHRGNGIAYISRNKSTAQIDALIFIHPDDVQNIYLSDSKLYYKTTKGLFSEEEVIHIKGFSTDGLIGKSVISYASETLGIAKSAQNFTATNYEGKGLGFGWVSSDKVFTTRAKKTIESAINEKLSAPGKVKTVMLDEGMKYNPITMNMQEAQLIQQGAFSVEDIARFLNISTRKLKASGDNYASAYMDQVDHVNDCLQPWMCKFELEYARKCFNDAEKRNDLYVKFNDNLLMRGDLAGKGVFYNQMALTGLYTRNEIRAFENMNPLPGLDAPLTPVNTQTPAQIQNKLDNE